MSLQSTRLPLTQLKTHDELFYVSIHWESLRFLYKLNFQVKLVNCDTLSL